MDYVIKCHTPTSMLVQGTKQTTWKDAVNGHNTYVVALPPLYSDFAISAPGEG